MTIGQGKNVKRVSHETSVALVIGEIATQDLTNTTAKKNVIKKAGAGERCRGVVVEPAAADEAATIAYEGFSVLALVNGGVDVAVGDPLKSDASGHLVLASTGDEICRPATYSGKMSTSCGRKWVGNSRGKRRPTPTS